MAPEVLTRLAASGNALSAVYNYEIIRGNALWRFAMVLLVIAITMAGGRILRYLIASYAAKRQAKHGVTVGTIFLNCITKPITVAVFAMGLFLCKLCLVFEDKTAAAAVEGISSDIGHIWAQTARAVWAIAVTYAIYRMVDIAEFYLQKWTSKAATKLDDMLVPVVRKSLRITIAAIAGFYIADNILGQNVRSILLGAGVGGIALALAAKDTLANFFGSLTIFADRPFQIDETVKMEGHTGTVEEVGFRSTRIRTLEGHLVTIPNSVITNSIVENVEKRLSIRRTSNITITYNSGHTKAKRAVEIIKEILAGVPEVNLDEKNPPRVYFNEFNDSSLNIYMTYRVKPPDHWVFMQVNERVNLNMMKRFEAEGIEFAFPTQTLYVK
jgi:MscS family membrane protein